jgi:hypothetical protein
MRFEFADPAHPHDRRVLYEMDQLIARWWLSFAAKRNDLNDFFANRKPMDLPAWMDEHLGDVHPLILWEFGKAVRGPGHRLVLTPEARKDLRPLVARILAQAPPLPGWEFYGYRLAEPLAEAVATVEARAGMGVEGIEAVVQRGEGNQIAIHYRAAHFQGPEDPQALQAALVLTETLLGEECLDHWIGEIAVERTRKGFLGFGKSRGTGVPLAELAARVNAEIEAIRRSLAVPSRYVMTQQCSVSMFQMRPEEAADYPERQDAVVHSNMDAELFQASLRAGFASERFSRCGETFCYLKIDGSNGLEGCQYQDRAEIEDAINAWLHPAELGSTIGGGTGLRYSYIDLALKEVHKVGPILLKRLAAAGIPKPTWLLFMDADRQAEWLAAHEETPAPPMRPIE